MHDELGTRLREETAQYVRTLHPRGPAEARKRGDQRRRRAAAISAALAIMLLAGGGTTAYALSTLHGRTGAPIAPASTKSPEPAPSPFRSPAVTPKAAMPSASPPLISADPAPTRRQQAANWDVDGDGRPDRARLVYLGGYGPDNWELVVDMTTLGRQAVRFTGSPVLPGNTAAPTIAGSVDADMDGHAEIFVKADSGASTESWTIFKLAGRQVRQVTTGRRPLRLPVGGSVTHQGGFRCDGAQFVTVSEAGESPGYTTWTYQRDTYAWSGAELVPVSRQTGQVTSAQPGSPPAAYRGVRCGGLPQSAPPYTRSTG